MGSEEGQTVARFCCIEWREGRAGWGGYWGRLCVGATLPWPGGVNNHHHVSPVGGRRKVPPKRGPHTEPFSSHNEASTEMPGLRYNSLHQGKSLSRRSRRYLS